MAIGVISRRGIGSIFDGGDLMNARCRRVIVFALTPLILVVCGSAWADPLPGEILKFQQLPLNNGLIPGIGPPPAIPGAPYYGHDELSTAVRTNENAPWQGVYMADDFADKFDTPVVHVRWWGSYINDQHGNPTNPGVKQFLISFEDDVAAGAPNNPVPWSHPGDLKFNQIVDRAAALAPGSGTFTEKLIPTPIMDGTPPMLPSEALYEYNAELHLGKEFQQLPDTVYWLKIVALVDAQRDGFIQWGWHNRDWSIHDPYASVPNPTPPPPGVFPGEHIIGGVIDPAKNFESPVWHFQDDAVTGEITVFPDPTMPIMPHVTQLGWEPKKYVFPWDGPTEIQQYSKDLAFELYTIPEPASCILLSMGLLSLALIGGGRQLRN
jgi:hypothetical protein